jgi:polyhydroxyalkanoate synthesis regulator phasin
MAANLGEDLKKIMLAGIGAATIAAEKTKALINELVKKGELSAAQGKELVGKLAEKGGETVKKGKALNEELKHNIKEKMNEQNLKSVLDKLDRMGNDEIEAIRNKLNEMEKAKKDAESGGEKS